MIPTQIHGAGSVDEGDVLAVGEGDGGGDSAGPRRRRGEGVKWSSGWQHISNISMNHLETA